MDYQTTGGADPWTSPFAHEDGGARDPRRGAPNPHQAFDGRVQWQSFEYDWLGNTTATRDDARGFYDRSLGAVTNGAAAAGPYQLKSATNASSTPGAPSREGRLGAAYDETGNLTSLDVRRDGPCLPATAVCSQHFAYDWDEVGRLARARRWDTREPSGSVEAGSSPQAELRYVYDANDDRVVKRAVDAARGDRYDVYPFDAYELRGATFGDGGAGDYARDRQSEVPYLFAHGVRLGRVEASGDADLPSLKSGATHVFLELMDHLGSTGLVVDRETSELVEASTYQAYGAAESDYRPERWKGFREDYRFTGKEEDIEVGLQYFGKRYYAPSLGRWVSADPLAVHTAGSGDPNVYAYVRGRALVAVDRLGLDDGEITDHPGPPAASAVIARQAYVVFQHVSSSAASAIVYLGMRACGASLKTQADVLPVVTASVDVASAFLLARQHAQETASRIVAEPPAASRPTTVPVASAPPLRPAPPAPRPPPRAEPPPSPTGTGPAKAFPHVEGSTTDVASLAAKWQGNKEYPGVDKWSNVTLPKGSVIAVAVPGMSGFATTPEAVEAAGRSAPALFGGLQVKPHDTLGFRPGMTLFQLKQDVPAAFAKTEQNPDHGPGGAPQYFVPNLEQVAVPTVSVPLKK